ncbi:hypothetical protein EV363DRAFT_1401860 [Boletus edulis]|nr:hypothetical protein EV363DRAFT_1401860 [Boletus edulis]
MIHTVRFVLYCVLFLFAAVTLALSAVRIHYTTHIPPYDPTNYGVQFYGRTLDTIYSLIIACSARTIHSRLEHRFFSSFAAELIGLFVFFLLWLVGVAIATNSSNPPEVGVYWGNLSSAGPLRPMLAFAWLSWIVVFALFVTSLLFAIANKALREPMHGRWDRRATQYGDMSMRNLP